MQAAGLRSANVAGLPSYPSRWPRRNWTSSSTATASSRGASIFPVVPLSDHQVIEFRDIDPVAVLRRHPAAAARFRLLAACPDVPALQVSKDDEPPADRASKPTQTALHG